MTEEHITNEQLNTKLDDHVKTHNEDALVMNQKLDKVAGIWWKIGAIVLIPFLIAVYGYGVLNEQVANLKDSLATKANKETVETQLASINQSLVDIKATLLDLSKRE